MLVGLVLFACNTPLPRTATSSETPTLSDTSSTEDNSDPSTQPVDTTTGGTTTTGGNTTTGGTTATSGTTTTGGTSATSGTTTTGTTSPGYQPNLTQLGAGLRWVRTNRPFVSGLTVNLGAPPATEVDRYYDDFHATATHLWETGLPAEIDGWAAANHPDFRWVSWTASDGTHPVNGTAVGDFPVTPGRIGYQIFDEPRNMTDLLGMEVGTELVRAVDPDALVIYNFGNTDGTISEADLVDYALANLGPDVIAYDYYDEGHGEYERANIIREAALDYGVPYWRYIDAYGDNTGRDELSAESLRWAAMVGPVMGFTGHTWFLYDTDTTTAGVVFTTLFDNLASWSHTPTSKFDAAAELNLELEVYGETMSMLTSTDLRYVPESVLYKPDIPAWNSGACNDFLVNVESVNVGMFETQEWVVGCFVDDAGEDYIVVQNANHEGTDFPLYRPSGDLRLTFDFAVAPSDLDVTTVQRLNPTSGAIEDESLTFVGGTTAQLDWTLPAGDIVLLKYKTSAPFARRN